MTERADVRYQATHCSLRNAEVWAILVRQGDGHWKVNNCLDKEHDCYGRPCLFTTDGGTWPYPEGKKGGPGVVHGS